MLLKHYFVKKIAHSSYILAGQNSCAVIDPQRDIDLYIAEAQTLGVQITHILQTHLHADFVSGHMDLAKKTGAKIYMAKSASCTFDHVALIEGDTIEIENMTLKVLETPGHTPEHLCYVVIDKSRGDGPIGVFVGDTLFVGDVGRPDLFPEIAKNLAEQLYHSLHDKLFKLPDYCEVYPAHGAGSLCGRSMGAKYLTTIGYERKFNPVMQIDDKQEFIKSLTENMPPAPDHFRRCSDINRYGPKLFSELPVLGRIEIEAAKKMLERYKICILDTRDYLAYGSQHIPNAWHLDLNGSFPTFAGWVLPVDRDFLIVADDAQKAKESNIWARRVGVDRIIGYLNGGIKSWITKGLNTKSIRQLSPKGLYDLISNESDFILLDVRASAEFEENHIQGAINIPAADLRTRYTELNKDKLIVLICSSGNRSSLGTSILEQKGFNNLSNVAGGMTAYSAAGLIEECKVCMNPHGSRFFSEIHEL
jgi:glyoxylase-like metal-dependent hydrolase (beta-lactamase superfamily II)/rhodanese-related sulfurtransferase